MAEFKVIQLQQIPAVDAARRGKLDRLVIYEPAGGPPRVLTLPDETFSEASLKEAVRRELERVGQFVGKTFST